MLKGNINRVDRISLGWEKTSVNHISGKGLISNIYIKNSYNSTTNDRQMANKYMKRHSKTTRDNSKLKPQYHLTLIKMVIILKKNKQK